MCFCEKTTVFLVSVYDDKIIAKIIQGIEAWVQLLTVNLFIPCLKEREQNASDIVLVN